MAVVTKMMIDNTHKFTGTFKDIDTGNEVEMSDVSMVAKFYQNGEQVGDDETPSKSATGIYDLYHFLDSTDFTYGVAKCVMTGETDAGAIKKRVVIRFEVVDSYN